MTSGEPGWGPMRISFDRIADIYDDTRSLPEDIMKRVITVLAAELDRSSPLLDVGVGTGRFAKPLQDLGYEVVGIDVSTRMVAKAVAKGTDNLLLGDACHLPFRDGTFGSAISVHLLHLISTWDCALAEISRVAEGKLLSVTTHRDRSGAQDLWDEYDRACLEQGYEVKHPGIRERELPERLKPDYETLVAFNETVFDVPRMIDGFEERKFSNMWFIPEEIHSRAIEAMRTKFSGVKELANRERIEVVAWRIDGVRDFVQERGGGR